MKLKETIQKQVPLFQLFIYKATALRYMRNWWNKTGNKTYVQNVGG
jgi:hypothetical protein